MIGTSWTHRIARPMVRPLLGTWVRPNHITSLRVLTGTSACILFAQGSRTATELAGAMWLISAFLDRADGELARMGNLMSHRGHMYDYYADTTINSTFFVSIGIGLRHSWLGEWSLGLGLLTGVSIFLCSLFAEWLELRSPPGTRAYSGRFGFDPDDALYLMAPLAWLGWLSAVLVGAAIGAPLMMVITGVRLLRLRREVAVSARTPSTESQNAVS